MGDFKITNRGTHCVLSSESAEFTLAMNWFTALCNLPFGVGDFFKMVLPVLVPFMAWMFPGDDILSRIGLTKSGDEKSFARACETLQIPQDADKSRVMRAYIHLGQEATSVTNATCAESWAKQQLAYDTVKRNLEKRGQW